ncbi:hypothetical protein B566_EDAN006761 [Ephemera danica]|nr:hypothetical protein B566_EDAN006761 [Ephemera danica]
MKLGDIFPNFEADSTEGSIKFYDWLGESWWCALFSHPADFTPVCTTELSRLAKLSPEFAKRGVKILALSCDSVATHREWMKDIDHFGSLNCDGDARFPYPIIADENRKLATELGMLDPFEVDKQGLPLSARAVFIIDPAHRMRLSILYPATTGRNFNEILRTIDSLQLTEKFKVATPADWLVGDKVMVIPSVPESALSQLFPGGVAKIAVPSGRDYMRCAKVPSELPE